MENENKASPDGVAADLMPKRTAFIKWAAGRGLDVTEVRDAWGARRFLAPIIDGMWEGWFNSPAASALTETSLAALRESLKWSSLSGQSITLSHASADALHHAMTTPPPAPDPASEALKAGLVSLDEALASGELQQLKAEAQALAADGANWSMDVGCMFVLAMIERIEAGADQQPAGYIDRFDLPKLGNCRATLWAQADKIDPVPLFRGPPDIMLQEFLSIIHDRDLAVGDRLQRVASRIGFYCKVREFQEDLLDIVRTLLCSVDHYWSLPDDKREAYPSPTSELSPLMQAARRACVERGYTAGGLAIDPSTEGTPP